MHEPDELIAAARALASEIAANAAPLSAAITRQMFWRMATADHPMEAHRADSRAIQVLGGMPDAREALAAFMEKRARRFEGRVTADLPDIWPEWSAPDFR